MKNCRLLSISLFAIVGIAACKPRGFNENAASSTRAISDRGPSLVGNPCKAGDLLVSFSATDHKTNLRSATDNKVIATFEDETQFSCIGQNGDERTKVERQAFIHGSLLFASRDAKSGIGSTPCQKGSSLIVLTDDSTPVNIRSHVVNDVASPSSIIGTASLDNAVTVTCESQVKGSFQLVKISGIVSDSLLLHFDKNKRPSSPPPPPPAASSLGVNQANGFDVNDVSYLFPRVLVTQLDAQNPAFRDLGMTIPEIKIGNDSSGSTFITKEMFNDIMTFAEGESTDALGRKSNRKIRIESNDRTYENWRVSSFRYDPCFPTTDLKINAQIFANERFKFPATLKDCIHQIRLIVQPYIPGDGSRSIFPADVALHLVYSVGSGIPTANDPILAQLKNLRIEARKIAPTAGVPLGVHPALSASKPGGAFPEMVRKFIASNVNSTKLTGVAMMGLEPGTGEPWVFLSGAVKGGKWIAIPGPSMTKTNSVAIGIAPFGDDAVQPSPEAAMSTSKLFNFRTQNGAILRQERLNMHIIEHPEKTHFFNMDCVSCHTTTSRIAELKTQVDPTVGRYLPPRGVTGFIQTGDLQSVQDDSWNFRNFGWFSNQAVVSMRTATETAAVVDFTNKALGEKNAGISCNKASLLKIWQCNMHDRSNKDCLKLCVNQPD